MGQDGDLLPSTEPNCDSKLDGIPAALVKLRRLCSCPPQGRTGTSVSDSITSPLCRVNFLLVVRLAGFVIKLRSVISSWPRTQGRVSGSVAFCAQTDSWNKTRRFLWNVLLYLFNCSCGNLPRLLCEIMTPPPRRVLSFPRLSFSSFPGFVLFSPLHLF